MGVCLSLRLHRIDGAISVFCFVSLKLTTADFEEYRGVSYAIGGDEGSITIPRILQRYTKPHGQSLGSHPPLMCPHASCQHLPEDALNAATSGAVSLNLPQQANGEL